MTTAVATGITLGTGGVVAGAAVAAAGAVGLGLVGLAALFRRGDNDKGQGNGYGYGHRHRRSTEEDAVTLNNVLNLIRREDITGCGLKLMCDLASKDTERLTIEELSILSLVGPVPRPGEGLLPEGGAGEYMLAKALGQEGRNCSKAYPLCALSGTQLMETVMGFLP